MRLRGFGGIKRPRSAFEIRAKGGDKAKFWLRPIALAQNAGFDARTLRELEKVVEDNADRIERVWNDHFR